MDPEKENWAIIAFDKIYIHVYIVQTYSLYYNCIFAFNYQITVDTISFFYAVFLNVRNIRQKPNQANYNGI